VSRDVYSQVGTIPAGTRNARTGFPVGRSSAPAADVRTRGEVVNVRRVLIALGLALGLVALGAAAANAAPQRDGISWG
jgi:hypothetical protein